MSDIATLATALVLGFLHALEIDHMLAVTTFVSRRPALATAAGFGLRWGIGHSLAVLLLGGVLLATGLSWPERWTGYGEAAVGVMLVALGLWSLRATKNLHVHPAPEHGDHLHLHTHRDGTTDGPTDRPTDHDHAGPHRHHHHHGRGITLVGLAHGLAGTSAVVALVPVTMVGRTTVGIWYLVAFGVGVTVAMTLFALGAAVAVRQASLRSLGLGKRISTGVGLAGVTVGLWWIVRAMA
jgi:ABC-type nickel/cobalt efflux system permease component RcnA